LQIEGGDLFRGWETLMHILRKATMIVAGVAMTVGLIGVTAPAQAQDTGWDCPGCAHVKPTAR